MTSTEHSPFANARFEFLANGLVRMQWASDGIFEDRGTLAVPQRPSAIVSKITVLEDGWVELSCDRVKVLHREDGQPFHPGNLLVKFRHKGNWSEWRPGDAPTGNLGGTARTLDLADGDQIIPFKPQTDGQHAPDPDAAFPVDRGLGLLSRDGWAVVDDSRSAVLDPRAEGISPWAVQRQSGERIDWYFLGYGLDFKQAMADAALVFGSQPLMPRWALGYWYSRYWAYTDRELESLADEFESLKIPLDVLVIDMDWHLPGWTGYTWCPDFFPDPSDLLARLHQRGLRVSLNLHPADGVGRHEAAFPAMCHELGLDPSATDCIPFDCTDPRYMTAYFRHLHHSEEERGVDLWWMDWQQGSETSVQGLDPLSWLNHLHWQDQVERRPNRRPMIFSRYGGIGSGRYPAGFSGDTFSNWNSLAFQPGFTAQSANVLFGTWSHDIGGHLTDKHSVGTGAVKTEAFDPEIYVRWVQFGIFSPIFRTHASKSADMDRRFWAFPEPFRPALISAARERCALLPYLYTEMRRVEDHSVSLCHPLYIEWPDLEESYQHPGQYLFGSQMMIHPVTGPVNPDTGLADLTTWIPPGDWFDTAHGALVQGSSTRSANYLLHETPVFVRAGSVIARQGPETLRAGNPSPHLIIDAYPGGNGKWEIYEDDGESLSYRSGEALWIPLVHRQEKESRQVLVGPALGDYKGASRRRRFTIRLHGTPPPHTVTLDGSKIPWRFDGMSGTLEFSADDINLERETCFEAHFDSLEPTVFCHGWKGFMARMESLQQAVNSISPVRPIHPEERLTTRIAQTGNRLTRFPETCREELLAVERDIERLPQVLQEYDEACTRAKKQKAAAALQRAARLLSAVEKPSIRLHPRNNRAFTLVEILAVVAILALLAAVMLPAYGRMQQNAGAVRCATNLRQISTYLNQFAGDNNGCLPASQVPGGKLWYQELTPYFNFKDVPTINQPDVKTFVCPQSNFPQRSDRSAMGLSYGYNQKFLQKQWRVVEMTRPLSRIILLAERWSSNTPDPNGRKGGADAGWAVNPPYVVVPNTGGNACLRVKHGKSSNYLFLDGHIERLEPAQTYPDGQGTETDLWIVK